MHTPKQHSTAQHSVRRATVCAESVEMMVHTTPPSHHHFSTRSVDDPGDAPTIIMMSPESFTRAYTGTGTGTDRYRLRHPQSHDPQPVTASLHHFLTPANPDSWPGSGAVGAGRTIGEPVHSCKRQIVTHKASSGWPHAFPCPPWPGCEGAAGTRLPARCTRRKLFRFSILDPRPASCDLRR